MIQDMAHSEAILHFSARGRRAPRAVQEFAARMGYELEEVHSPVEIEPRVSRSYPTAIVLDGTEPAEESLDICRRMKAEAFTSVVPVIV